MYLTHLLKERGFQFGRKWDPILRCIQETCLKQGDSKRPKVKKQVKVHQAIENTTKKRGIADDVNITEKDIFYAQSHNSQCRYNTYEYLMY